MGVVAKEKARENRRKKGGEIKRERDREREREREEESAIKDRADIRNEDAITQVSGIKC